MKSPKITQEDLNSFRNFENQILSLDSKKIKYKTDQEIESQIKLSVLIENFGKDRTYDLLSQMGINSSALYNQNIFIQIYNSLKSDNAD